ncbi:MAG: M23 family metallopeptidase [Clostridium sp.]|nr:M23 family metallopeptidase [Clostridium sp.]
MIRNRYPRQSMQYRRRTRKVKRSKYERKSFNIIQKIILQVILCILIIAFAAIIKGINSPVTNYFENKIINVLTYNIDIKGFFQKMDTFIQKIDDENQKQIAISDDKGDDYNIKDDIINDGAANYDYKNLSLEERDLYGEEFLEEKMVDSISYNVDESDGDYKDFHLENKEYSFIIPVGGTISCFFGEKIDSSKDSKGYHEGINIEAETGTPIRAAYNGEVLEVGKDIEKGMFIEVKHKKDVRIIYFNCSELLVEKGQYISKGDVIAKVGNSGNFKNPSLYLVMLKNDIPVNPLDYIGVLAEQDV